MLVWCYRYRLAIMARKLILPRARMGSLLAIIGPRVKLFLKMHTFQSSILPFTGVWKSHHYHLMISTEVRELVEIESETIFRYFVFKRKLGLQR